jgi:arylsulfatase A
MPRPVVYRSSSWVPCLFSLALVCLAPTQAAPPESAAPPPPNIVVIFADDLGYDDVGPFYSGDPARRPATPSLDRMAAEGMRLTHFYVAQAVCSASRAALLTGSYPNRIGIRGALDHRAARGLSADETTIAELLRARGYATGIFGKWHLGHQPPYLPKQHGFDEYFGLPYSNDMWPRHPQQKDYYPPLPLIDGDDVVERDPDQRTLTRRYTERAVSFIERHRDRPFFLYVPHSMPHVPIYASAAFEGRSGTGLYGDVIAELDWSVGEILRAVARHGLDGRTMVVFMSDNGPWMSYGNHAGSPGPFRESKGTAFEGGVRVPFLARWPGRIPPGSVSSEPTMTIDLLPTVAAVAGVSLPERRIDGRDIWRLLSGAAGARSPHEALFFYWGEELHAVRSGPWKLHLAHPYRALEAPGRDGAPGRYVIRQQAMALYDLGADPGEDVDVAAANPAIVARLQSLAERAREDLGDTLTQRRGAGQR